MKLQPEIDAVIEGPCSLFIKEGKVIISGIQLSSGDQLDITEYNYFTITSINNTEIETDCRLVTTYRSLGWHRIVEEIVGGKILVIGDENSGKTYLSNSLVNLLGGSLIDSDVGQSSLFLPTFISYTEDNSKKLTLVSRTVKGLEFFGNISPSFNPRLHIALILLALKKLSHNKNIIIDSDGWVKGFQAYKHKIELIYSVDPDYIIVFNERLASDFPRDLLRKMKIVRPFPLSTDRDRVKRRKYRSQKYKEYFGKAKVSTLSVNQLLGVPISKNLIRVWDQTLQLVEEKPCSGLYIDRSDLLGLLLALTYKGEVVGAAMVKDIKEENNQIDILTPVENYDGAIMGEISLNEDFTEKRVRIKRCCE
ncbi:Clp1/GlmU family protein [Stygiolobus caldivivus]|uniref:polynucleotide 5'-hydroxyl-kinase n=1 Tax=Stygiolobus caldivivus TaxID=2824673 RepID=A0A8D5U711_9CREN|nr:Clp1/GlmU family protein [Stygiolobus caldivivus]BCU70488.1 hypothetical protein KN1_17850 [Stygiolobus caldivivus]